MFKTKEQIKGTPICDMKHNKDEGHIFVLLSCFLSLNLYCFYLMIWFDALVFGLVVSHFILVYSSSCVMISFHFLSLFLCFEACVFPSLVFFSLTLFFSCGLFRFTFASFSPFVAWILPVCLCALHLGPLMPYLDSWWFQTLYICITFDRVHCMCLLLS